MKDLIRKILLESEWDWVDEIDVVPPHPLSEEDLPYLVGWSFLYDEHANLGRWAHNDKLFKITQVLGDTIYWLYGNGDEENSDSTSSFIKQVNNGYWVLVSPEGILYDPLYKRDWKGGVYYSKEDLNESDDLDWIRKVDPHIPFNQVKRNHKYRVKFTDVFFDALRTCNVPQTMVDQLSEVTVVVALDKALKMKYNISFCNHEREDEVDTIHLTFVDPSSGNLFYGFYVTEDMLTLHDNNITESSEWSWVTDSEPYHDVEFYVGKPLKVRYDGPKLEDPYSDYRIERTTESPEAYNICWNEVIPDNEGAEGVYRVCTRYRATSIIRMLEDGTLSLDLEKLNESEDLQWVKDVDPMDPYQPYVGMKWRVVGKGEHLYEIYEVVGIDDKIMSLKWKNNRGGYEELWNYRLATYFNLVRNGNVEIVYDGINESSDGFDWARGETLLLLSDYVYEYKIEDLDELIGVKVKLSPESRYYKEQLKYVDDYPSGDRDNPIDVIGIIVSTAGFQREDNLPLYVKWSNDVENNYNTWDLDIVL